MGQNVMITGTGRSYALGFNLVRCYLEAGDRVVATVRKKSEALERLKEQYAENLYIVNMDIGSTESVKNAAAEVAGLVGHLDLLINNAVLSALGVNEDFLDVDMDSVLPVLNVTAVGTMRVMQAFYPLLKKSAGMCSCICRTCRTAFLTGTGRASSWAG